MSFLSSCCQLILFIVHSCFQRFIVKSGRVQNLTSMRLSIRRQKRSLLMKAYYSGLISLTAWSMSYVAVAVEVHLSFRSC